MNNLKRIGIVGCGAIGGQLARSIAIYFKERARLMVLCDSDYGKAQSLSNEIQPHPDVLPLESIPLHCDLVIEAASPEACRALVPKALEMGRDVMIMSVGGLVDIYEEAFALARSKNVSIYIPSGDIAGIDALEAAMTGGVASVCLTVRIPTTALDETPFAVAAEADSKETIVFEGSAREAIQAFPFHVNVAATLSMAGLGLDQTRVQILTGPSIASNSHEIEIEGAFGRITTRTESPLSPQNPKTSQLAVLSACATLNEILSPVKIGT